MAGRKKITGSRKKAGVQPCRCTAKHRIMEPVKCESWDSTSLMSVVDGRCAKDAASMLRYIDEVSALGEPVDVKARILENHLKVELGSLLNTFRMESFAQLRTSTLVKAEEGAELNGREQQVMAFMKLVERMLIFRRAVDTKGENFDFMGRAADLQKFNESIMELNAKVEIRLLEAKRRYKKELEDLCQHLDIKTIEGIRQMMKQRSEDGLPLTAEQEYVRHLDKLESIIMQLHRSTWKY